MLWYVAIGSAVGGVSRFVLGGLIQRLVATSFPTGTLVINITGSLLLGFIVRYAADTAAMTPEIRAFLTVGFCGGYTTFSTFSYEALAMLEDGDWRRGSFYIVASLVGSLVATFAGFVLARELMAFRTRL